MIACGLNDAESPVAYHPTMAKVTKIHAGKTPRRIHFIAEWAAKRGIMAARIAESLGAKPSTGTVFKVV